MAAPHPRLEWLEPAAGTTAFPRVRGVDDTSALVDLLIREYDAIVVPGRFFQAPRHIRVGFGGETNMVREAVSRLDRALRQL
jgi:aspartate/methionine/tyrosine aminotransferase